MWEAIDIDEPRSASRGHTQHWTLHKFDQIFAGPITVNQDTMLSSIKSNMFSK
jgi:hypothetical protein